MLPINSSIPAKSISYGGTRPLSNILYICIHFTGNESDRAISNCRYFSKDGDNTRSAGAHYFVDGDSIYQSIADNRIAWAVGGSKLSGTGGTLHGVVTNSNSISVEMCSTRGAISQDTLKNTAELVRHLMELYHIDADHVVRHWDVTGKLCPGWEGWTGNNQTIWYGFKQMLSDPDEIVSGCTCTVLIDKIKIMSGSGSSKTLIGYMHKGAKLKIKKLNSTGSMAQIAEGVWVYTKHLKRIL